MNRQVRALKVAEASLRTADIGEVSRVFDQVVASPQYCKRLRGSIMFAFGERETDPRRGFESEAVRRYAQRVDARYPFFAYFLPPDSTYGQLFSWMASLATPVEPEPGEAEGIAVDPREFTNIVVTRILAVRSFCDRIEDDPDATVNAILEAMPEEIASAATAELKP
jgi:hypothetical protein